MARPGPMHGFARTMEWTVEGTALGQDGSVEIALVLEPDEVTRGFGYDAFHLRFRVTIGRKLEMKLETRNDAAAAPRLPGGAAHLFRYR